jgi:uncharacterized protein
MIHSNVSAERDPDERLGALKNNLARTKRVLVAYSGGVDSTFLLWAALETLGSEHVVAATARSPIIAARDLERAAKIAGQLGARHLFVPTQHLENPKFVANPRRRCYVCKKLILTRLADIAREEELLYVIEGSNQDDQSEYRPGTQAVREANVRSPLAEVGLTKADIRTLSHRVGLPTWDQPAQTCLATRFPYDQRITAEALAQVEAAEDVLHAIGFGQLRVRHHGAIARIEVSPAEIPRLARPEVSIRVTRELKKLGYRYICLDLAGYQRGNLEQTKDRDLE